MAIQFTTKKKKELYLILICLFLFLVLVLFWMNFLFFRKSPRKATVISPYILEQPERDIKIDFKKLESQFLKDLQPFKPISPPQKGLGRKNPFAPAPPAEAATD